MRTVLFVGALVCLLSGPAAGQQNSPQLEKVADFQHQVTGVTVSEDGRIFVHFPRWTEDAQVSVAEITTDGAIRPFPDPAWNTWRNASQGQLSAHDRWVCVQSVVADGRGNLWVLDPAAPATALVVPTGPKLVRINLATNQVVQNIALDERAAPQGSYMNDVRISPDGDYAYITDSGASGALVVVDLRRETARRVLDGHPTTQPEPGLAVKTDGEILRRPDGRGVQFAADGIAMSRDGRTLFWQALTGRILYRVPTEALRNDKLSDAELAKQIEVEGINGVSDGLLIARDGRMYISALEENAVKVRNGDRVTTVLQDERLRWPDTFSEGPDGAIYVTASRIMDSAWYKPDAKPQLPTSLWRFMPEGAGAATGASSGSAPAR